MDISLLFATLLLFLVVVASMAIGVIISKKTIKGSCGGLSALSGEKCQFCNKPPSERANCGN